jgi:RNA-directed DNA polymerase
MHRQMMEDVCSIGNLRSGFQKVKKNTRRLNKRRHEDVKKFEVQLEENLAKLRKELLSGSYKPKPFYRKMIPKPGGQRKLGISRLVNDLVVQATLCEVLSPEFDEDFSDSSYGFREGRGPLDALRRVMELLDNGFTTLVDADIEKFFDTIPHQPLLALVEKKVTDERVINLVRAFLKAGYMHEGKFHRQELGTPQGANISPLLANIYLDPMDHLITGMGFCELVRYADDFLIFCRNQEEAVKAEDLAKSWLKSVGLRLNNEKTEKVQAEKGFSFLSYHFIGKEVRRPKKEKIKEFHKEIRKYTPRSRESFAEMVDNVNRKVQGWYEYFKLTTDLQPFREIDNLVWDRLNRRLQRISIQKEFVQLDPKSRRVFSMVDSYVNGKHSFRNLEF